MTGRRDTGVVHRKGSGETNNPASRPGFSLDVLRVYMAAARSISGIWHGEEGACAD